MRMMTRKLVMLLTLVVLAPDALGDTDALVSHAVQNENQAGLILRSNSLAALGAGGHSIKLDGLFYETTRGRTQLPAKLTANQRNNELESEVKMADGRVVRLTLKHDGRNFIVRLGAQ